MIITEQTSDFIRHYSDLGYRLRQIETGAEYDDAWDIYPCPYTYEEADLPIDEEITAEQALNILLGGSENNEEGESDQI